ncbi:MAG: antitermination protein NusG [Acidobacteria bacterium]|nr:MAG: antitermination protein NusG [Acidobacteriota bacterium]
MESAEMHSYSESNSAVTNGARAAGFELPPEYRVLHWYAVYTCPRHEKSVALQMERQQVPSFLPLYKSVRRWKDRQKQLELPLFPGYVFVQMALKDRLQVLQTSGVVQLVSVNGKPAILPDSEIDDLRNGLTANVSTQFHPYLSVGRHVRVHSGPLAGLEGILVRRKDKFRLVLSIHLLKRSVALEVSETDVEPVF